MIEYPLTPPSEVLFDADLFVDREYERQRVQEAIHNAGLSASFLEFQGISGQGKSELLKWIFHQAGSEGYCAAYIDFASVRYYRTTIDPLLETMARHLEQMSATAAFAQFRDELPAYRELLRAAYLAHLEQAAQTADDALAALENSLIHAFHTGMRAILATHTVVLCLDSTERAYARIVESFEALILRAYLDHPAFVLITAGQDPLVWRSVQIKDRMQRIVLPPLKREAVCQQIRRLAVRMPCALEESAVVADKIVRLTLGHPYSVYKLMMFLTADRSRPISPACVDAHTSRALTTLVAHVIEERILDHRSLGSAYPPIKDMLWYLAPLRRIEMNTFRHVLSTYLASWFRDQNFIVFEQLAGELQQTAIFTEWRLGDGFNMDPLVRHLLLSDMHINALAVYLDMQEQLSEHYDGLVAQTQDATQIKNIVERLYHYAVFLWGTQPNSVNGNIRETVREYLHTYFGIRDDRPAELLRDQIGRLYRALKADEELGHLINVAPILGQIEEHRDSLAA